MDIGKAKKILGIQHFKDSELTEKIITKQYLILKRKDISDKKKIDLLDSAYKYAQTFTEYGGGSGDRPRLSFSILAEKYMELEPEPEPEPESESELCAICQEEFSEDIENMELHCGHNFHKDCIKKWFAIKDPGWSEDITYRQPECPTCRQSYNAQEPEYTGTASNEYGRMEPEIQGEIISKMKHTETHIMYNSSIDERFDIILKEKYLNLLWEKKRPYIDVKNDNNFMSSIIVSLYNHYSKKNTIELTDNEMKYIYLLSGNNKQLYHIIKDIINDEIQWRISGTLHLIGDSRRLFRNNPRMMIHYINLLKEALEHAKIAYELWKGTPSLRMRGSDRNPVDILEHVIHTEIEARLEDTWRYLSWTDAAKTRLDRLCGNGNSNSRAYCDLQKLHDDFDPETGKLRLNAYLLNNSDTARLKNKSKKKTKKKTKKKELNCTLRMEDPEDGWSGIL